jgi:hypothetical protein
MPETLTLIDHVSLDVAMPAHAAEPVATSRNAARWCSASRAGFEHTVLNEKSGFRRCIPPASKKLEVERRADREGAGGATSRRSDLATQGPAHLGRCITDGGRSIRS